ncbi:MAG: aminoglycoside phosphotransferase family protein [bacterium]
MQNLDLRDRTNMFYWQTNRKITAQQQKEVFLDRYQVVKTEDVKAAIQYAMKQIGTNTVITELSEPIEFGSVNTVRSAKMSDGSSIVVRMHPYHVKNGYFWSESVAVSEAKKQGALVYDTLFVDDSMNKFPFAFMIMTALPGKTLKEYTDQKDYLYTERVVRETGRNVALIHKVTPSGFGFFLNNISKNEKRLQGQYQRFEQHIFAALEEDLNFLKEYKVIDEDKKQKIVGVFESNRHLMNCPKASLIHNDVADWNETGDGEHVTGLVDWDECFAGDPAMDFAAYSLFYGEPRMTWFKEGYQEIAKLPDQFEEKFQLYKLRYLVSKLHLRKKRLLVYESENLLYLLQRGLEAMAEVFDYFKV